MDKRASHWFNEGIKIRRFVYMMMESKDPANATLEGKLDSLISKLRHQKDSKKRYATFRERIGILKFTRQLAQSEIQFVGQMTDEDLNYLQWGLLSIVYEDKSVDPEDPEDNKDSYEDTL